MPVKKPRVEPMFSIAPLITELQDAVLVLKSQYQEGRYIQHALGEVRNVVDSLEDALEKNAEAVANGDA